jgi:hypothetical protein
MLFADNMPLQNVAVVVSTARHSNGMTVTLANEGTTTLTYYAADRSGIQLFQEFEEMGVWTAANWDWCGTGKEDYELAPGKQFELAIDFWDTRRERMVACFTEKDTNRSGMIVLAAEGGRIGLNVEMLILLSGTALTAFCVWLAVRIANRHERWAKWIAAALVVMVAAYPLSMGPAYWFNQQLGSPEPLNSAIWYAYAPIKYFFRASPEWLGNTFYAYLYWWTGNQLLKV